MLCPSLPSLLFPLVCLLSVCLFPCLYFPTLNSFLLSLVSPSHFSISSLFFIFSNLFQLHLQSTFPPTTQHLTCHPRVLSTFYPLSNSYPFTSTPPIHMPQFHIHSPYISPFTPLPLFTFPPHLIIHPFTLTFHSPHSPPFPSPSTHGQVNIPQSFCN